MTAPSPTLAVPRAHQIVSTVQGGSSPLEFRVVHAPNRLLDILQLRRTAHLKAQKIGPHTTAAEMVEPRDLEASFVIAEEQGRVVAAIRFVPPIDGTILHRECQLEGDLSPLPPREQMLEVSSACVDPAYQGQGLVWALVARAWLAAPAFGRPYGIGACDESLWRFWQRCGVRRLDAGYVGAVTGIRYRVILLEFTEVLAGRGVGTQLARELQLLRPDLGALDS